MKRREADHPFRVKSLDHALRIHTAQGTLKGDHSAFLVFYDCLLTAQVLKFNAQDQVSCREILAVHLHGNAGNMAQAGDAVHARDLVPQGTQFRLQGKLLRPGRQRN